MTPTCGLIVNPVAGIGGEAALAGSDGEQVQALAASRGFRPRAPERAERALRAIRRRLPGILVLTGAGAMGEDACRAAGVDHRVVEPARGGATTAADSVRLATRLREEGVELLLFAGGDGTARDISAAIGESVIALGIPSGVKMHSGVFTITPEQVAPLVDDVLAGRAGTEISEVVDIDEDARRAGRLGARLYGHLRVPVAAGVVQRGKSGGEQDPLSLSGIAGEVASRLEPGVPCLLGPGTTVRDVIALLGHEDTTLLGIDILEDGVVTGRDLDATALRRVVGGRRFQVLLSPIGGQGIILGRGNQQLDAALLSALDPADLLIVAGTRKLGRLGGGPLLVDAPTEELNERFRGRIRVIIGNRQEALLAVR